jgi:CRP/FNR family transcriptional regulator, cyclic AMP receptor protein
MLPTSSLGSMLSRCRDAAESDRRRVRVGLDRLQPRHPMSAPNQLMTIERVAVLKRVSLFVEVPGHTLVAVARVLEEISFEAGDTIIERGTVEDWLFVVAEGRIRVHIGEMTLLESGPGGVVGEFALLAPAPRSASATAVEPSLLLRLRRGPFEELLDDHPEIARALISTLARMLQASADNHAETAVG